MTLDELIILLDDHGSGRLDLDAVHARLLPVLTADPLDVETSDSGPWDDAHIEARLFWRIVYLLESEESDTEDFRRTVRRLVSCVRRTGRADLTFELLPIILDQDRFADIIDRHDAGIISRTGFLSVIAESGYPPHVKLWLEHARCEALARLATELQREDYDAVAAALEMPPG